MNRLVRFAHLPGEDRRLLTRAIWTMAQCQARLRLQQTSNLRSWASVPGAGSAGITSLVLAIERASRVVPASTCLVRALSLQRLLSQHGYASEVRIGVAKTTSRFSAHAWLVHENEILIGEGEEADDAHVLTTWATTAASLGERASSGR